MDYAMEFTLMSEIYDDMTAATEGLLGVDNLIDKILKAISRLIRRIVGFIRTKLGKAHEHEEKELSLIKRRSVRHVKALDDVIRAMTNIVNSNKIAQNSKGEWEVRINRKSHDLDLPKLVQDNWESFQRNFQDFGRTIEDNDKRQRIIRNMYQYWELFVISNLDKNALEQLVKSVERLRSDVAACKGSANEAIQEFVQANLKTINQVNNFIATLNVQRK